MGISSLPAGCCVVPQPAAGYGDVPGSDCHAVRDGAVSVTPLDLDLTHAGLLERLPGWRVEGFEAVLEEEVAAR